MKICENGIIREMTAEEIAEMQQAELAGRNVTEELTQEKKIELMLAAIPTQDTPNVEPKVGYRWKPIYTASAGFAWELVEDPNALGTMKNPLRWAEGIGVKLGYHYADGERIYLALDDGVPEGFGDEAFFAEV